MTQLLDIERFRTTPLKSDPYDYAIVPGFVRPNQVPSILKDFPRIDKGGSYPLTSLAYGSFFGQLCRELQGPEMAAAFSEKFQLDLTSHPTTLTVRGRCRPKDGKIHTDSKSKLITVLVYLNENWQAGGGRLRVLRSGSDINDYVAEVPPEIGTLLCFRNGPNAWHGHTSFDGVRRTMQLNWVTDSAAVRKSERRHGFSAFLKRMNPFAKAA